MKKDEAALDAEILEVTHAIRECCTRCWKDIVATANKFDAESQWLVVARVTNLLWAQAYKPAITNTVKDAMAELSKAGGDDQA